MAHLVETMFSARVTPWHRLGVVTAGALTSREAITAAGLDWEVRLQPVFTQPPAQPQVEPAEPAAPVQLPDHRAVVRDTDHQILGVVSSKYRPFQNREAFSFFDNLVASGEAMYETAGSLKGGRLIWMMAKLPEGILIADQDPVDIYLLLQTSHDGTKAITVSVTPTRVVCANTLRMANRNARSSWSVRHTTSIDRKIRDARTALALSFSYTAEFTETANQLARVQVTDNLFRQITADLIPDTPRSQRKRDLLRSLFNESPTMPDNLRYTGWGAVNTVAEFFDHITTRHSPESRFAGSLTQTRAAVNHVSAQLAELTGAGPGAAGG